MPNVDLTVSANIAGLRKELEKIPGITAEQARQMTAELNASFKASERAAREAAEAGRRSMEQIGTSADDAATSVDRLSANAAASSQNFGVMGSSAAKVAGALDLVVPGLGNVARGAADVADVFEVAALGGASVLNILGPIAVAATAAAGAYQMLASSLAEVEERNLAAAESARIMQDATNQIRITQEDLDIEYQHAAGNLTDLDVAQMKATKTIKEQYRATREILEARRATAAETVRTTDGEWRLVDVHQRAQAELDKTTRELAALDERQDAHIEKSHETLRLREENNNSHRRATRVTREHTKAVAEQNDEFERAKEELAALVQRVEQYQTNMAELTDISSYFLSEEEKLTTEYAKRRGEIEQLTAATMELATTEEARQEAAIQGSIALAAAEKQYNDELQKIRDEQEEARLQEIAAEDEKLKALQESYRARMDAEEEMRRAQAQAAASAVGDIVSTVTDSIEQSADRAATVLSDLEGELASNRDSMTEAEKADLKERIAMQRQQAQRQFEIAKTGRLAEAAIATAASVANALATPPAPNLLLAGLATATGAAQLAAIAAVQPSFHSGGMVPDETQARLLTGEAVLSRTGRNMIGDDQINRANAGMSGGSRPMVVVQQYRHRVYNDFIRDNLRIGGNLADAIRGTRTVGMREAL